MSSASHLPPDHPAAHRKACRDDNCPGCVAASAALQEALEHVEWWRNEAAQVQRDSEGAFIWFGILACIVALTAFWFGVIVG